jgi:hypothetical protein
VILGSPVVSLETLSAVGLWGTLLAAACCLAIREQWSDASGEQHQRLAVLITSATWHHGTAAAAFSEFLA